MQLRVSAHSQACGTFHQLRCHWYVRSDLVVMWINWCFLLQCGVSRGLRKGSSVRHHICGSLCPSRCLNYSCTKAPAHICRDCSFPALWACSNVTLWGPKLPLPSHPVPHPSLSWPQTPSSSSSTLVLCSIFQPLPPYPIAFSLYLPCPSSTLWLYKDRHYSFCVQVFFSLSRRALLISLSHSHVPLKASLLFNLPTTLLVVALPVLTTPPSVLICTYCVESSQLWSSKAQAGTKQDHLSPCHSIKNGVIVNMSLQNVKHCEEQWFGLNSSRHGFSQNSFMLFRSEWSDMFPGTVSVL